jgi:hypothetical protein
VEDLHTALTARNRYLGNVADESDSADVVDAAESGH